MEGYQTLRQLGFGLLDMAYHSNADKVGDIKTFETEETKATNLYPSNPETAMSTSFSHIFQGGYLRVTIPINGRRYWMRMLFSISRKTEFSILKSLQNIKFCFLQEEQKIRWNCIKTSGGSEPKVESLLKRAFE